MPMFLSKYVLFSHCILFCCLFTPILLASLTLHPHSSRHKQTGNPAEYRFYTEFQSHEAEFDYLKSMEIEEKINQIEWLKRCNVGAFWSIVVWCLALGIWRLLLLSSSSIYPSPHFLLASTSQPPAL